MFDYLAASLRLIVVHADLSYKEFILMIGTTCDESEEVYAVSEKDVVAPSYRCGRTHKVRMFSATAVAHVQSARFLRPYCGFDSHRRTQIM